MLVCLHNSVRGCFLAPDPFHPFGGQNSLFGYNFLLISLLKYIEDKTAHGFQFYSQGLTTPISVFINLSLALAVVITLPVIYGQIYGFIAPGLYLREKKVVSKYIFPFALLFTAGAIFRACRNIPDSNESTLNILQGF